MEPFVPLPVPLDRIEHVRAVRSTLLSGSIQALRNRNMFEDYFKVLAPQHHEAIRSMVAGVWIPLELAKAHYDALERLIPDEQSQLDRGATSPIASTAPSSRPSRARPLAQASHRGLVSE